MSLLVYTAHAGGCHRADSSAFDSLAELKLWIEQNTGLAQPYQIIMSARGTAIKLQSLINEKEIYVFDRRLLESGVLPRPEPIPPNAEIPNAPSDLQNERDLGSWKALFERRVAWADTIVSRGTSITASIQQIEASLSIMKRSVQVAYANLNQHYGTLRTSAEELRGWAEGTLKDQNETLSTWERSYRQLSQIPLHEKLGALVKNGNYGSARNLQDLFNPQELQKAANDSGNQAKAFISRVTEASTLMVRVGDGIENLGKEIEQARYKLSWESLEDGSQMATSYGVESQSQAESEPELLLHDMNAVSKKIKSDYDRLNTPIPGVPITLPQVSKWAHVATKDLLPALAELLRDLAKHHRQSIEQKNRFSVITAKYLQAIATIQGQAQPTKGEVDKIYADLNLDSEGYQQLHTISRLPLLYGSLLVECVRRKEWQERLTADSRRMAEEFALLKEDEEKKRKKFQRTTGELLPFTLSTDSTISVVDLSMRAGDDKPWPSITRQDVESYMQRLKNVEGMEATIRELAAQLADLDKPAKRRSRQTRGFKMGSVHEANLASSSFFPNDDMARLLREEKARSLEKARNYEIRIKKLEELAYRNISRGSTGTPGPYPLSIPGTPLSQQQFNMQRPQSPSVLSYPDSPSRPASVNSRRFSFVDPSVSEKEKQLVARISALETELATEQDKTARLEKDVTARIEGEKGLNARISEGESTKRDLVANLEALQAEFLSERKSLTSTIDELKQKLYEAEEELYRVDELRLQEESKILTLEEKLTDNTTDFEERVKSQEEQIAQINAMLRDKEQIAEQLRTGLESWKAEVEEKNAEIYSLTGALEKEKTEVDTVSAKLVKVEKELQSHVGDQSPIFAKAKQIYELLSNQPVPTNNAELIDGIYKLTVEINKAREELSENAQKAEEERSEKEAELLSAKSRFNSRTQQAKEITNKLYSYNSRCIQLLEQLGFSVVRRDNSVQIIRLSRNSTSDSASMMRSTMDASRVGDSNTSAPSTAAGDINLLYWMDASESEPESEKFQKYLSTINAFDLDTFAETITKRVKDAEHMARKYQRDARSYREKYHKSQAESAEKIAYKSFKEGDLALFLPTRNQASRPWAAFNVGAPHYFLREQDSHKLRTRDWLLARISKVEEKVVDLSRPTTAGATTSSSPSSSRASSINENPFELSDGLRWYFLDAVEEKPGAPATPGLGSSTVASAKVDAKGSSVRPIASTSSLRKPSTATSAARNKLTDLRETESRRRSGSTASTRPTSMVLNHEDAAAIRSAAANANATGGNAFPMGTPSSGNSMMVGMSPPISRDGGVSLGGVIVEKTEKRTGAMGAVEKFVGFMKGGDNHHHE